MNKHALAGKLLAIGLVALALWCASLMVLSMVREREKTRTVAVSAITTPWGGPQILAAPFLAIPYKRVADNGDGKEAPWRYVYVLPEQLDIACVVDPEKQQRGLFQAVVYSGRVHVSGHFSLPDWQRLGLGEANIALWPAEPSADASSLHKIYFTIGASSERALRQPSNMLLNASPIEPSGARFHELPAAGRATGVKTSAVEVAFSPDNPNLTFSFDLELTGSETLMFSPLGQRTTISLRGNWPQPRLIGQYPPQQFEQNDKGFLARWSIDGDAYPRSFSAEDGIVTGRGGLAQSLATLPAAGVKFFDPLDDHRKVERVTKYAAVFILFTFAAFFIAEVKNRTLVHPIQYLMVGGGIVIFYLLLLSVCEHAGFAVAYLVSALATVTIIALYAWSALRSRPFSAVTGVLLCILYSYFYLTTQMEDYALLAGSLALFVILAAVMYSTRQVNWYRLGDHSACSGQPEKPDQ